MNDTPKYQDPPEPQARQAAAIQRLLYEMFARTAPSAHAVRGTLVDVVDDASVLGELPDPSISVNSYARLAVETLWQRGLINEVLLERLNREFPYEASALNDIRRLLALPMRIEKVVSFDLLMDNWAYQEVAQLFAQGPRDASVSVVQVGQENLSWRRECWAGVALESLLSILSGVVLRDRFLVEERFIEAWQCEDSPVLGLHAGGILVPVPEPAELWRIRSPLYKELFHTPALQRAHQENIDILRDTGTPSGRHDSLIMWGAVGYLARSAALGAAYVGHPARKRFLAQTPFANRRPDAGDFTIGALDETRAKHFAAMEEVASVSLGLVVPPLLVNIIEESRDPEDLILVALQYRERYRDLRRWLAHFQKALHERNPEQIKEYHDTIKVLLRCLEETRSCGSLRHDIVSRTIYGLPGLHRAAAVLLERLAVTRPGEKAIDKLLALFKISGTVLETPVLTHLRTTVLMPRAETPWK